LFVSLSLNERAVMERKRGNAASASRHFEEDFFNVALRVVVAALFFATEL